jgi:hypothetical protein
MRRVAKDERKRFVLTTREHILNQARQLLEVLDRESSDAHRFLLTIERYSRRERARIFYNHIYFSDQVDEVALKSLLTNRRYLEIIDHPGYSPRLIEWITGLAGHRLNHDEKERFADFCLEVLDAPSQLWRQSFEHGLDEAQRTLVLALSSLPPRVSYEELETAFEGGCGARGLSTQSQRFRRVLAVLDDSFVSTHPFGDEITISAINPSLIDFTTDYLLNGRADAEATIRGSLFAEQALQLWTLLSPEGGTPDDRLLPAFSDAFQRTMSSKPLQTVPRFLDGAPLPSVGTTTEDRLTSLLDLCDASEQLAKLTGEWLPEVARAWITEAATPQNITRSAIRLFDRLAEAAALDLTEGVRIFKVAATADRPKLQRWDLLSEIYQILPDAFDPDEWRTEQAAFAQHVDEVLTDAPGYLDDLTELEDLEAIASTMGVELGATALESAWQQMEEADAENDLPGDWGPDYDDDYRSGHGNSSDDGYIESMFEGLANDR